MSLKRYLGSLVTLNTWTCYRDPANAICSESLLSSLSEIQTTVYIGRGQVVQGSSELAAETLCQISQWQRRIPKESGRSRSSARINSAVGTMQFPTPPGERQIILLKNCDNHPGGWHWNCNLNYCVHLREHRWQSHYNAFRQDCDKPYW